MATEGAGHGNGGSSAFCSREARVQHGADQADGFNADEGGDAMRKVLAHTAALIGLYLAFSFALFLGLQVRPLYGNIGLGAVAVLAALYVYIGFIRR